MVHGGQVLKLKELPGKRKPALVIEFILGLDLTAISLGKPCHGYKVEGLEVEASI